MKNEFEFQLQIMQAKFAEAGHLPTIENEVNHCRDLLKMMESTGSHKESKISWKDEDERE